MVVYMYMYDNFKHFQGTILLPKILQHSNVWSFLMLLYQVICQIFIIFPSFLQLEI